MTMSAIPVDQGPQPMRRWLALVILLAVVGMGAYVAVTFWQQVFESQTEIAAKSDLADALKAASRRVSDKEHPEAAKDNRNPYLQGETDTIAAANFSGRRGRNSVFDPGEASPDG
jgi:Tfp pilus assembly protein PilE